MLFRSDATEQDILQEARAKENSALQEAIEWLRKIVTEAPRKSEDIRILAEKSGISNATYRRARNSLQDSWEVETVKTPGLNKWVVKLTNKAIDYDKNGTVFYI